MTIVLPAIAAAASHLQTIRSCAAGQNTIEKGRSTIECDERR
ncbi:hypothetical protein QUB70_08490 [Microcoleus sp. A003_D6]